jgi:hypothetical protein
VLPDSVTTFSLDRRRPPYPIGTVYLSEVAACCKRFLRHGEVELRK